MKNSNKYIEKNKLLFQMPLLNDVNQLMLYTILSAVLKLFNLSDYQQRICKGFK